MFIEFFGNANMYLGFTIKIVVAILLGGIVGMEREMHNKDAGLRTNILICLGATLFTSISVMIAQQNGNADLFRVSAQIVSGIGFLGAGAIIKGSGHVTGLTTAATIWTMAAVGLTVGLGYIGLAFIATIAILTTLLCVTFISANWLHKR